MNEQKLFDASLKHIRKQGIQSSDPDTAGTCMYHMDNGLKCAFAPAIQLYDTDLEGNSAVDLLEEYPNALYQEYRNIDKSFAIDIQVAHDDWDRDSHLDFISHFEAMMEEVAVSHGLEYSTNEQ